MTNNDILQRLQYTFGFEDDKIISIFGKGGFSVTRLEVSGWMKNDSDTDLKNLSDNKLACFLNGLIVEQRGQKDGNKPKLETKLNNNIILKKLKIALNFQAEEVLSLLKENDVFLSKNEISAFFRKEDHKNYMECNDQILQKFLKGIQEKYRP